MALEDLFKVVKTRFNSDEEPSHETESEVDIPADLLFKCPRCSSVYLDEEFTKNLKVCKNCGYHARITARERLDITVDKGSFSEFDADMISCNPIDFPGYDEKQAELREKTGLKDAVITGEAEIRGEKCVIGIMDSRYMMASMGSVVGEKITRAFERATEKKLPIILFTASGGARMQEGIVSLMQMAKTSGAAARHSAAGLLYITVMTDPTTGGVTASFASEGDIIIAEPKVLIGFAGRRVIEGTIKQRLPEDFQSAEFQLEHGFVDMITERKTMRRTLAHILKLHKKSDEVLAVCGKQSDIPINNYNAWERLEVIRNKNRPTVRDYIPMIFSDFFEMHGDRLYGDDGAIISGIARLGDMPVTVIAQVKGRNIEENKASNFSMPHPEGYRKALRLAKQAEKFHRPVICFIDTPGAFCGVEAEKRGQGEAIARNLFEFMTLKTPVISIVLGEGGSGGALALGVCDELAVMEYAQYSVISPRGFASILWKDASREKEACCIMKITAEDLVELGVAERIIEEPAGGAHNDPGQAGENIAEYLREAVARISAENIDELLEKRYNKFRKIGVFNENCEKNSV